MSELRQPDQRDRCVTGEIEAGLRPGFEAQLHELEQSGKVKHESVMAAERARLEMETSVRPNEAVAVEISDLKWQLVERVRQTEVAPKAELNLRTCVRAAEKVSSRWT